MKYYPLLAGTGFALRHVFRLGLNALFLALLGLGSSAQAQFTLDREPPGPSSRRTGLILSEIMYNPLPAPGVIDTNQTLEFIELYNTKPWTEDITGFAITGDVTYQFPSNTLLAAKSYLVVARVPELIQSTYGITNVVGPWEGAETNRLSIDRGLVQLRNRQGAVLLETDYRDSPPWPEAADGTGHSLSLVRPSRGEANPEAWAQSDTVGGSPGGPDPVTPDPLASVFINEWQNHSDPSDWVELYNHANTSVDLSGAYLSDAATSNFFRIPNGTVIAARGFKTWDQNELGFQLFAGGETVFFWSQNRQRIIDVIDFRGQSNNVSSGRSPDGGPFKYGLANRTRGSSNSRPLRYPVIINEIMYNPPTGNTDDEYVELYNRGSRAVKLSGWEFVVGIHYTFPTNNVTESMPAGAHWVLAKNPAHLMSVYTNLTTNNTFGPYDGTLANGGERLLFTAADYDRVNNNGQSVDEKLPVPVSEVIYSDGGKWTDWSDGRGSSLELIDPDADTLLPANWADSDTPQYNPWTAIEMDVPMGPTLGEVVNDRLILMLQGIGECLVDEIEVRADHGPNLVPNGGFESGLDGWVLQGSHDFSTLENEGFAGGKSLHLRAASRGDNQSNRILSPPLVHPIPPDTQVVSIRVKARWLHGARELLLRMHGSATEAYGAMAVPSRAGTPGEVNSRHQSNIGPAIYAVQHSPPLPVANQPVVVTARATDPQGVLELNARYRIDPDLNYTDVPMADNGTSGDAIANDGIYSAMIPAQAAGTMVAFYIEGRDGLDAVGTFPIHVFPEPGLERCWPNDAVRRECVVRWGEVQMPGDFATYHLWVSSVNSNRWHTRNPMDNAEMDGTFVYNNERIIYNAIPLFSGSPWHRTNSTAGPAGELRVDYEMNFPDDDPLLGSTDFVLNNPGNPNVLTVSDQSALSEQTVYEIFAAMDMPHNQRRYIHLFVNGSQRSTVHERPGNFIFEDSQQPNGEMIDEWFPNDAGGALYKVEDWFEFADDGFQFTAFDDADLARVTVDVDGQPTLIPGPYRYKFRRRSGGATGSDNAYNAIFQLIDAVSPAENPNSTTVDPARVGAVVDWEEWMRFFAIQRAIGNFDSYGWERGKNDYLYMTTNGFVQMPWDIDYGLGLGRPADAPLLTSSDPRIVAMFNTPAIVRAYWRGFADLVGGPFRNEYLDPLIDKRSDALVNNNINIDLDAVQAVKTYIADRRAFLVDQLATVQAPFAVAGSSEVTVTNNLVVLTGTAPVEVKDIQLNGVLYPITWTTVTNFELRLVVEDAFTPVLLEGVDRFGAVVASSTQEVNITYTGPVVEPHGALVISELQYAPERSGAQFIEIQNISPVLNFDLSGWRLDGVNLTFPPGSIVTNGQILVLAQNAAAFQELYGTVPLLATFGGSLSSQGETIALVRPGLLGDDVIDGVRYESREPWPIIESGSGMALQLVDPTEDNSRVSNWAVDPVAWATPGAANSVTAPLPAYDPLWLNEVQTDNLGGPADNQGEHDRWIEIHNSGTNILSLDGYYLATNYASGLTQWPLPAGATLAPGEYQLLWADGQPEQSTATDWHTDFALDYDGQLALVRLVDTQPQITDYLTWNDPGANASYGSAPDGQAVYRMTLHEPTPGSTNRFQPLPVFINEWMARNNVAVQDPADGSFDDWFELYNAGLQSIDLGGYYLTDDPLDPTQYAIPNNGRYALAPRSFRVVWADSSPDQNSGGSPDLHVNFKLAGDAGWIGLYAPDGLTLINSVTYGQQTPDFAEGRYTDGASALYLMAKPTPGGRNTIVGANTPPAFPFLPRQFLAPGERRTITIRAEDPEFPDQLLRYDFAPERDGAAVNQSGLFRWIVPTNQPPGDYAFDLTVTDNGVPPRHGVGVLNFTITAPGVVAPGGPPPPVIQTIFAPDGQTTFTIQAAPGQLYRVEYTSDLGAPVWHQLDQDFIAGTSIVSLTDTLGAAQRFYRVVLVLE